MEDIEQQSDALNKALEEEVPKIKESPNPIVELIRGVHNAETGMWETTALVRELNGFDEEAIASLNSRKVLFPELLSFILKRAVLKIGNVEIKDNQNVIDHLIVGDRDLLFLGVIRATYGDNREYTTTCQHCGEANDVIVGMDELTKLKDVEGDGREPFKTTLSNGVEVSMRLPNGSDSLHVTKKAKTIAEQNTMMLSRCVVGMKGVNTEDWAKNLNLKDRSTLINALVENQPGPKVGEVDAQCASCGENLNVMVDWASLLFN